MIFDESASVFGVLDYGAKGDGATDDTAAFQAALDAAGARGGIVYAPAGNYRFSGHLNVPVAVTLQGTFGSVPAHNGCRDKGLPKPGAFGTVLMPTGGKGTEEGAFITLNTNATLKGLLIYYPEQTDQAEPYPYPWCVAMRGKNPAILDVEMLNPYNAVDACDNERHLIRGLYGQPLRRGIYLDRIYDIGRIEDVHFNPWWSTSKPVCDFMIEKGEAFIMGRTDWEYMVNCFSILYHVGFLFKDFGAGGPNVDLTQCGHDIAPYTAVVEATTLHAGVQFANCQFMGEFLVKETNQGPVKFTGCGFWGTDKGSFSEHNPGSGALLTLKGEGHVTLNGCNFSWWDKNGAGASAVEIDCQTATVSACNFIEDKADIHIGPAAKAVVVLGNKFAGGAKIQNDSRADLQCGFNIG